MQTHTSNLARFGGVHSSDWLQCERYRFDSR